MPRSTPQKTNQQTSTAPQQLALGAFRNVHTLCVRKSGGNEYADIPLHVSISLMRIGEESGSPRHRIVTRRVCISPDSARLLDPAYVTDDFYQSISSDARAVTEGQGAERLNGVLSALCGPETSGERRTVRYSLNARRDRQLIRNYLWREGYDWGQAGGMKNPLRIVDLRHALIILAGVSRTVSLGDTLPKKLRDYDLDSPALSSVELCRLYGVAVPDEDSESSALLRLVLAAREEQYLAGQQTDSEQASEHSPALRWLGRTIDHLEGIAGVADENDPDGQAKQRALQLMAPVQSDVDLTPSHLGLCFHRGAWFPVVAPLAGGQQPSPDRIVYALPDGRAVPIEANISAPVTRLDLLSSNGRWDAAADERLRRMCGWEGEPVSFSTLHEVFQQSSGKWAAHPGNSSAPETAANSNTWTRIHDGPCESDHYALAGQAVHAINRSDAEGAVLALEKLSEQASAGAADAIAGAQTLLANLRLSASRANLIRDGRKAWLRQMALLLDPDAWSDSPGIDSETLPVILFGDGPVARHNRIAIASRSAVGVPVSNAARAALATTPRSVQADLAKQAEQAVS